MTGAERRDGVLAGFATGFAGGFLGVGGGIILIPMLTGRFGLTQHQAHGTALAVLGATALASIVVYGFQGNVAWGTAALVGVASMVTARYGARLASRTSESALKRAFAVFMLAVGARLLWKAVPVPGDPVIESLPAVIAVDLLLGLAVGLLSGYMGVGGGVFIVPALTLGLGWPQQLAQGTSLGAILLVAPAGAIEHARHGHVVRSLVPALAIGAALGGPLASMLAQMTDRALLARLFAVFLIVNATLAWVRAGKKPLPSRQAARP